MLGRLPGVGALPTIGLLFVVAMGKLVGLLGDLRSWRKENETTCLLGLCLPRPGVRHSGSRSCGGCK